MKTCTRCGVEKNTDCFYKRRNASDFRGFCKDCFKAQCIKYRKKLKSSNPKNYNERMFRYNMSRKYGTTPAEYEKLLIKQKNTCAICKSADTGRKTSERFSLDHCHVHDFIRGLLCNACNTAIGLLKENTNTLREAIKYLKKHHKKCREVDTVDCGTRK